SIQMLAARLQGGKNHQVRIREKQLFRLRFRRFGRTHEFSQMFIVGEAPKVIEADPGQLRDFIFGEDFLAPFDPHHVGYLAIAKMLRQD
ncbi:MAG: hypothetical protein ACRD5R_17975, partial [Candidatus Acidiferrales bacterium]